MYVSYFILTELTDFIFAAKIGGCMANNLLTLGITEVIIFSGCLHWISGQQIIDFLGCTMSG